MANVVNSSGVVAQVLEPTHKHHHNRRRKESLRWLWWLLALLALSALAWLLTRTPAESHYPEPMTYLEWAQGTWEGDLGIGIEPDGTLSYPATVFIEGHTASFFVGCHTIEAVIDANDVLSNPVVIDNNPYGLCNERILALEDYLVEFLTSRPVFASYGENQLSFQTIEAQHFFTRPLPVN